eukprot:4794937-Pyramimonas_sp.AAC.1
MTNGCAGLLLLPPGAQNAAYLLRFKQVTNDLARTCAAPQAPGVGKKEVSDRCVRGCAASPGVDSRTATESTVDK